MYLYYVASLPAWNTIQVMPFLLPLMVYLSVPPGLQSDLTF